ncbi:hypothetical protein [Corynebacterium xerosis]|uniref:J domain-containing protein n=1 Tax=Corynebacterium xerosis TaxID=1725 RepID=A0ABV3UVE0_9CORY
MTTHDFYRSLGLDPSTPSPQIAADLDRRLAAPGLDATQYDELMTARHILGDPAKRATYDQALSDPATSLSTSDLYRLARSTTGQPQTAPAFGQQESWAVAPPAPAPANASQSFGDKASGLWAKIQNTFRTHPGPAIGGTAVAAVVVVGLIIAGAAAVGGDSTPGADTDTIASGDSEDNGGMSLEDQIVAGVKEDVEKREKGYEKDREDFKKHTFLKPGETVRFTRGQVTKNPSGASVRDVYAEWDVVVDNPRIVHKFVTNAPSLPFEHEMAMICYDESFDYAFGEDQLHAHESLTPRPIYDGDRIGKPESIPVRIPLGFNGDLYETRNPNGDVVTQDGEGETLAIEEDSLEVQRGGSYKKSFCLRLPESEEEDLPDGITGIVVQPDLTGKDDAKVQADKLSKGDGWRLDVA